MTRSTQHKEILYAVLLGVAIAFVLYSVPVVSSGDRQVGPLTTIHGIPFAVDNSTIHVEENLAHVDVFLEEPVFVKSLKLTISFDPKNTQSIAVGVREGGFWLGYSKKQLYEQGKDVPGFQTKELEFPLTSMFQETDKSIDVMLFSDSKLPISWEIHAIKATTKFTTPAYSELKEYIKSILKRERAL